MINIPMFKRITIVLILLQRDSRMSLIGLSLMAKVLYMNWQKYGRFLLLMKVLLVSFIGGIWKFLFQQSFHHSNHFEHEDVDHQNINENNYLT